MEGSCTRYWRAARSAPGMAPCHSTPKRHATGVGRADRRARYPLNTGGSRTRSGRGGAGRHPSPQYDYASSTPARPGSSPSCFSTRPGRPAPVFHPGAGAGEKYLQNFFSLGRGSYNAIPAKCDSCPSPRFILQRPNIYVNVQGCTPTHSFRPSGKSGNVARVPAGRRGKPIYKYIGRYT